MSASISRFKSADFMGSLGTETEPAIAIPVPLITQLARFVVIGTATAGIDFALLYALVEFAHLNYLLSALVGFLTGSTLNYFLSLRYVFLGGRFSRGSEFTIFMLTTAIGLALNQVAMWAFVGIAHENYLLAKCASLTIVTCWNFFSKKRLVFLG
jgi:putative flippase GtrA